MGKRAVLVGCNYKSWGEQNQLSGCVNDVWAMHNVLMKYYGFLEEDIKVFIDIDDQYPKPEAAIICQALKDLIFQSKPGDVLFFHYSGHGVRVDPEPGDIDETGHDECIFTSDAKLINDDAFRFLVNKLPPDVTLTIVADSCHSGGLIEHEKEQIGESFVKTSVADGQCRNKDEYTNPGHIENHCADDVKVRNRSMSADTLRKVLREKFMGNTEEWDLKSRKINLEEVFGEEYVIFEQGEGSKQDKEGTYHGNGHGHGKGMSVLVSGCQSEEVSADVSYVTEAHGAIKAHGALTHAIIKTIESTDRSITNHELVTEARNLLGGPIFKQRQRPGLYCADANANAPFICPRPTKISSS